MFRSVALAALVTSLAVDVFVPAGARAHTTGNDTSAVAESSVAASQFFGAPISESSALLLIGLALIGASRLARR